MKHVLRVFVVFMLLATDLMGQSPFKSYWTFERKSGTKNYADSSNYYNLDLTYYGGTYNLVDGPVGKALQVSSTSGNLMVAGPSGVISSAFTFEMIFKTGQYFHGGRFFTDQQGNISVGFNVRNTNVANYDVEPQFGIYFQLGNDYWEIPLNGVGIKSMGYYLSGWHHIVFKYDPVAGVRKIIVDGQCPSDFQKTTTNRTYSTGTLWMNSVTNYRMFDGYIDEVAYSPTAISDYLLYQHYQNFVAGQHYQYTTSINTIPSPNATTAGLDTMDFAPGYPSSMWTITKQVLQAPVARYRKNHTLDPLARWTDVHYTFGRYQPGISDANALANMDTLVVEWWKNFNYMGTLSLSGDAFANEAISIANNNPTMKQMLITLRAQISPCQLKRTDLPATNYLRNSSGQFLDYNGNVTTNPSSKYWSPSGNPSVYNADGELVKSWVANIQSQLTSPIYLINEDGEILGDKLPVSTMQKDPPIVAGAAALGLSLDNYYARKFTEMENTSYRDIILSAPGLTGTMYSLYNMDGYPQYSPNWSEARKTQTPNKGEYLSTFDFYPRTPKAWRQGSSAFQSYTWAFQSRKGELAQGDKHCSPFISAGYNMDQTQNIRPAQWLGLLKTYIPLGARFFYAGYFDEGSIINGSNPPADPRTYMDQILVPAYAQACASYAEDILKYGDVLCGDYPTSYDPPISGCGYNFWCGDPRMLVTVRKYQSKYLIAACLNPISNQKGAVEPSKVVTITLEGQPLTFTVRRQGSMYVLDKSGSSPVFYQLDGWQQASHPSRWGDEYYLEAELTDTITGGAKLVTYPYASNNYQEFQTNLQLPSNATASYSVSLRNSKTRYLFIKAKGTGNLTVKIDSNGDSTVVLSGDKWYRMGLGTITPNTTHTIKITAPSGLGTPFEIDNFVITDSIAKYDVGADPCAGFPTATITAATDTVCTGSTTTLTCNQSGVTYLWNNGKTTKTVTVGPGTYSVTITSGGCSSSSSSKTIYSKSCIVGCTPTGVYATPVNATQVKLGWNYNPDVKYWEVEFESDSIFTRTLGIKQYGTRLYRSTVTQVTLGSLLKHSLYTWKLTAICNDGTRYTVVGPPVSTL